MSVEKARVVTLVMCFLEPSVPSFWLNFSVYPDSSTVFQACGDIQLQESDRHKEVCQLTDTDVIARKMEEALQHSCQFKSIGGIELDPNMDDFAFVATAVMYLQTGELPQILQKAA